MSTFTCAIVGMRFRPPAQGILDSLCSGFPVALRREPGNVHDRNAVAVYVADSTAFAELDEQLVGEKLAGYGASRDDVLARLPFQLGYLPREDAEVVAAQADGLARTAWRGVLSFSATGQPRVVFQLERGNEENE